MRQPAFMTGMSIRTGGTENVHGIAAPEWKNDPA
jgi:hypothetical protein